MRQHRPNILKQDFETILVSPSSYQSTKQICDVAHITTWRKIWDHALDGGARGTNLMQTFFKAMSTLVFGTRSCEFCGEHTNLNYSFFEHLFEFHLNMSIGPMVSCAGSPSELFDMAREVLLLYSTHCYIITIHDLLLTSVLQ